MNQEITRTLVQISSTVEFGQKKKLEYLARTKANGSDGEQAPYLREALELLFQHYGVTDEQMAAVS